jgi:class 3 adenylate cyclase
MNDRMNKTSICSIVFLDIVDYSKKSDADQIVVKNQFNDLINRSLKGVAQNDRIILDTGDGVAIAYMGSPEDAMFVALTIRDGILKSNIHSPTPLHVRFGINLGPVRIVSDINGHPNIIGDGINVAQRIMSFAEANQILVSRSYYEITSRLTLEFSEMFAYSGVKHDKHVREHEVYSVRSHKEHGEKESQPAAQKDDRRLTHRLVIAKKLNWHYAVLALPVVIALGLIIKVVAGPSQPIILVDVANATEKISSPTSPSLPAEIITTTKSSNDGLMSNETVENLPLREATSESLLTAKIGTGNESGVKQEKTLEQQLADKELAETKLAKKMAKRKAKQKAESELIAQTVTPSTEIAKNVNSEPKAVAMPVKPVVKSTKTAELKTEKVATGDKTGWGNFKHSIKQGAESKCTQVEISMNQCR